MTRKKRGYKRDTLPELVRDYKLFAIACEGEVREPEYFRLFRYSSNKIAVDIIGEKVSEDEALSINPKKSAPKWVLDRSVKYIEKEALNEEDDLWFVMDVDRWSEEQLREIALYCEQKPNWHIVLSNPCFEVWLYFHKKQDIETSSSKNCKEFKNEIASLEQGGYNPFKFLPYLEDAIKNAKNVDTDKKHFKPKFKESKVYELGEAIIQVIGKSDFENFIRNTLPTLPNHPDNKSKKHRKH